METYYVKMCRLRLNDLIQWGSRAHPDLTITKDFAIGLSNPTPLWKLAKGTGPTERAIAHFKKLIGETSKNVCEYFDGGTCINDEEFPQGTPTEITSVYCSSECKERKKNV